MVAQGLGRCVIRGPIVKGTFFFYCAKKHKKITILINLNVQYSGSNHMHKVVQQISKPFLLYIHWYTLRNNCLFPLPLLQRKTSLFSKFDYVRYLINGLFYKRRKCSKTDCGDFYTHRCWIFTSNYIFWLEHFHLIWGKEDDSTSKRG